MTPFISSTFFLAPLCAPPKNTPASKSFRYVLASKPTSKMSFSEVSLRDTRTGRTLWKHRVINYNSSEVLWSKDHRALLLELHGALLIWRAGHPLLETPYAGVPRPEGVDRYDYLMGAKWSPDAHRLLLSFGMSGMGDMGYSRLFCMTLTGNHYKYTVLPANCYIRDMGWRSNRVAFYCPAVGEGLQTTGKRRLWHVP